jgi:hypothetical protein
VHDILYSCLLSTRTVPHRALTPLLELLLLLTTDAVTVATTDVTIKTITTPLRLHEQRQLTALLAVSVPSPPELSATYDGSTIISGASQVGENQGESSGNVKSSHVGSSNVESSNDSSSAMDTTDTAAAGAAADGSKEADSTDTNDNR